MAQTWVLGRAKILGILCLQAGFSGRQESASWAALELRVRLQAWTENQLTRSRPLCSQA